MSGSQLDVGDEAIAVLIPSEAMVRFGTKPAAHHLGATFAFAVETDLRGASAFSSGQGADSQR
jgi:hypothetical protein